MWTFNVVVTMANQGQFHRLMDELNASGDFRRTEFFGVILGQVPNVLNFLETLREQRRRRLISFQDVGRVVPLEHTFIFTVESFPELLCKASQSYINVLPNKRFHVRIERRGHKGQIVSPETERTLDAFLIERLVERGQTALVDYEDPDAIIAVETIGDRCGIGLLTRDMMTRYDFVRVS